MIRPQPQKDTQTVRRTGEALISSIEGFNIYYPQTHPDERGDLCEIFNPAWQLHPQPLVYVYQVTIRPGKVRGWVMHHDQDDRLFASLGTIKAVLYDGRETSPTYKTVSEFYLSELNRATIVIPKGVYHAFQNVGDEMAMFINMPTEPYNYANPDKVRLPPNNDVIPYRFEDRLGW